MKRSLLTTSLILSLLHCLKAESDVIDDDILLGVEAVTGYRSDYIYRGFELGESTLDFQLETEISLSNELFLGLGAWYATETGNGDFSESAFFTRLTWEKSDQLSFAATATYHDFSPASNLAPFESGLDIGASATWSINDDFAATAGVYYDTGAEGWYAHLETKWSKIINDSAFLSLTTGVSCVSDYYGRDGLNDLYTRLALTYHVSDTLSVGPYIGGSLLLDDDDAFGDSAFAGLWFIVRF